MSARRLLLPAAALLFGLTACGSTPAAAPASNSGTGPAPVATSAPAPAVTSAPATSTPVSSGTSGSTGTKAPRPATTKAPDRASCPSAKTLERLIAKTDEALPKDTHFVKVRCWKDWATADPKGPYPGDGFYLFHHQAGAGWKYHSQGSGYHCEEIGIHEPAPFCQYPG
jgi:hypothetical protein